MFGEKIKEECGIYGIYGIKNNEDVVTPVCVGYQGFNTEEKKAVELL